VDSSVEVPVCTVGSNTATSYLPLFTDTKQCLKLALFACSNIHRCILSPYNVIVLRDHKKKQEQMVHSVM
jgi:hypothetical protein